MTLNLSKDFKKFYLRYPFLSIEYLIENFAFFGGAKSFLNIHNKSLQELFLDELPNIIEQEVPFFLLEDPFRRLLIILAKSDGKYFSSLNKSYIGKEFGKDIIDELINLDILYKLPSREMPIKQHPKMAIKKELRNYIIQDKLIFTKPFLRFYFSSIEIFRDKKGIINYTKAYQTFYQMKNRLTSLVFEQLSQELLKCYFNNIDLTYNCYAYWDRFSEFDIYCQIDKNNFLVGECKFSNRPITKSELLKLQKKIAKSNLKATYLAFFSKQGFSNELLKEKKPNLLLFELKDFRQLLL